MGRGIALSFCLAGAKTVLIDIKERDDSEKKSMRASLDSALRLDLQFLVTLGMLQAEKLEDVLQRVTLLHSTDDIPADSFDLVFEGVPEHSDAKEQAFTWMNQHINADTIIASTTSTFLVDDLAKLISSPERYANAHWLNPAHLMPLVEISRGSASSSATIDNLKAILETVGKTPIVCSASPGYIVPRIQALAMNEAARLAEEGVASPEDIDKAIRVGFGIRYAILGMLEFIDWGGGDILYYASDYLSKNVDKDRYTAPKIVHDNMHNKRNGVSDGEGFFDYKDLDVNAYREQRMSEFVGLLKHLNLLPLVHDAPRSEPQQDKHD